MAEENWKDLMDEAGKRLENVVARENCNRQLNGQPPLTEAEALIYISGYTDGRVSKHSEIEAFVNR